MPILTYPDPESQVPLVKQQIRILQSLDRDGWIVASDRNGKRTFFVAMPRTDVRFYIAPVHFYRLLDLEYIQHNPLMERWTITPEGREILRAYSDAQSQGGAR